jgi:hypothetical protein
MSANIGAHDVATADPVFNADKVTVLLDTTPSPEPGPTVSVAAGGSCAPSGRAGTIALALGEGGQPSGELSLSVTSSNQPLVPTSNIGFAGSGDTRSLTVRPVAGHSGTAVITVNRLSYGQLTGSIPVTVRVAANGANSVVGDPGADILSARTAPTRSRAWAATISSAAATARTSCRGARAMTPSTAAAAPTGSAGPRAPTASSGGPARSRASDFSPAGGDSQDGTVP